MSVLQRGFSLQINVVWGPQETREDGGRRAETLVSDCRRCPVWPQGVVFTPFTPTFLLLLDNTRYSPLTGSGERAVRASRGLWKDTFRVSCIWCTGIVSGDILICAQVCSFEWHWLRTESAGFVQKCVCNFRKGENRFRAGEHFVILCCSYGSFPVWFWGRN